MYINIAYIYVITDILYTTVCASADAPIRLVVHIIFEK